MNPTPPPSATITMVEDEGAESSDEDSALNFRNEIQQEYINRNRQANEPVLLNSVNSIKAIQDELKDTQFEPPQNIKGFGYKNIFQEIEMIGRGGGGTVYKVMNKIDECLYAVKIINLKGKKQSYINQIMKEVLVLSKLQHQNIVRYHNA